MTMAADWKTRVSKEIDIPQIDFAEFKSGDPKVREACAQKIVSAFKTIGFVYLANALPIETKDKAFALAKGLFAKSTEEKEKIAWESFTGKRGFVVNGKGHSSVPGNPQTDILQVENKSSIRTIFQSFGTMANSTSRRR